MTDVLFSYASDVWIFISETWKSSPTFFPGVIGAGIAFFSIRTQRRTSREKNSLDFEAAYKRNDSVVKAWSDVLKIRNNLAIPVQEWGKKENSQTDEAKALKIIFNEWERCANAVNNGLYDDLYLYRVYGSTLIFLDVHFEPYMAECRKTNPRFYRNLKILALRWHIRRGYEDLEGEAKNYLQDLKKAQKCVEKLNVKY